MELNINKVSGHLGFRPKVYILFEMVIRYEDDSAEPSSGGTFSGPVLIDQTEAFTPRHAYEKLKESAFDDSARSDTDKLDVSELEKVKDEKYNIWGFVTSVGRYKNQYFIIEEHADLKNDTKLLTQLDN